MSTTAFHQRAADIDWYCEQRGVGPPVVLIPSGEGDCESLGRVADLLADEFNVVTFDMPGFSRSSPPPNFTGLATDEVTAQIAALLQTLSIERATIYGCSSGGLFALALAATHPELVRNVIVHELAVPLQGAAGPFEGIFSPDDTTVVKTCEFLFRNVLNENPAAWDALGTEYHARLAKNYLTWARVYVASPHPWREFTRVELTQRPVTWTVGHPPAEALYAGNRKVADVAGIPIGFLPCRHFPQVSIPSELGAHIRAAATQHR